MQAVAQAFAQQQHVRAEAQLLVLIQTAGTTHAALNFIHNKQRSLPAGPLLQLFQPACRRADHPGALIGLHDDGGDILSGFHGNFSVQKPQAGKGTAARFMLQGAATAIGINAENRPRRQGSIAGFPLGKTGHGGAEMSAAMDAVPEGQNLAAALGLLGQLHRPFGGL